jgi:hypothetical protein
MTQSMSTEVEYRDVEGFPGYKIGSDGSVWSCRTHTVVNGRSVPATGKQWKKLKPFPTTKRGYLAVTLMKDAKRFSCKVYHLVLKAFVGPAPDGQWACHNDGDTSNNRLENLRWDTVANNHSDKRVHGTLLQGEQIHNAKITTETAKKIKRLLKNGERPCDIARRVNVSQAIVLKIKSGTHWKHVTLG